MDPFILKEIKENLGDFYPKLKRKNDLNIEIFRLQAVLTSPYLHKNMFNFLTFKLLKLEKESLELNISTRLEDYLHYDKYYLCSEYYEYYDKKRETIELRYNIDYCGKCQCMIHHHKDFCDRCLMEEN